MMDATELLEHDHRIVEQMFRDYETAASAAQRRGVVEILIRELSKHAALEELLVYPLAKRLIPEMADEVDEHLGEHMGLKKILATLDRLSAGDRLERDLVAELKREVDHHVQEEEGRFFPTLRETLGREALEDLGEQLREGKRAAPTRPHPHAPNEPPALAMAAPVAAMYDRVRDRLQRRPRT
ncbi:hemerythrin domain-containing protein [Actinoallomurus soli]|uniref:hemerythrin domain-containing protein n=1 Tax=Actinoallomurus soli TaxID=2952535 RepID=UPI0020934053|nr:hemerythrin domain-containing protein [Actinoallomurus soli]MCO5973002.1 hemerythrin domain-containing protein [Actinoallomurus soli]